MSVFQIMAERSSSEPQVMSMVSSGLHARYDTASMWPKRMCLGWPEATSQMMARQSLEPDASMVPLWEKARFHTSSVCTLSSAAVVRGMPSREQLWSWRSGWCGEEVLW